MTHEVRKTYVELFYPGIFMPETSCIVVKKRDPAAIAKKYPDAFAFTFHDVIEAEVTVGGQKKIATTSRLNESKRYYPNTYQTIRPAAPVTVPAALRHVYDDSGFKRICVICNHFPCDCEISEEDDAYGEPTPLPLPQEPEVAALVDAIVEVVHGCDPRKEETQLRAWLTKRLSYLGTRPAALAGETRTEARFFVKDCSEQFGSPWYHVIGPQGYITQTADREWAENKCRELEARDETRIRLLIEKNGEKWVAHCLELDLVSVGESKWEAVRKLSTQMHAQIDFALKNNSEQAIWFPAPKEFFDKFEATTASRIAQQERDNKSLQIQLDSAAEILREHTSRLLTAEATLTQAQAERAKLIERLDNVTHKNAFDFCAALRKELKAARVYEQVKREGK